MGVSGYPFGMGMARTSYIPNVVLDFIPGDIVCNSIIATTAYAAQSVKPEFQIYHNSMSTSNPYKIYDLWSTSVDYIKFNPFEKQIREPRWWAYSDKKLMKAIDYIEDDLPKLVIEMFASIPYLGSKQVLDQVKQFKRMKSMVDSAQESTEHFRTTCWYFDSRQM